MTVRDIQHHLARTIGTDLSHDTISRVTNAVAEEVKAWQARPLEELYLSRSPGPASLALRHQTRQLHLRALEPHHPPRRIQQPRRRLRRPRHLRHPCRTRPHPGPGQQPPDTPGASAPDAAPTASPRQA